MSLDTLTDVLSTQTTPYNDFATTSFQYIALYTLCTTSSRQAVAVRNAMIKFDRRSHWFVYVG